MQNQLENSEAVNKKSDYINQRWSQLHALEKECAERVVKYLLLTNSGGGVAVLSFMGTSEKARAAFESRFALLFFVLGVIFIGFFNFWAFHRVSNLFHSWKTDAKNYSAGKISWEYLVEEDDRRSNPSKWAKIWGYGSFIFFIFGCIFGAMSLFK